jgi:hypothetical protein
MLTTRQPEVGGGNHQQSPGEVRGLRPVGAGAAGEPGQGAESKVLHHAALRHHARVLARLANTGPGLAIRPVHHRALRHHATLRS